jgi:hypothetical protein
VCFASLLNLQLLQLNPGADAADNPGTVQIQL